MCREIEISQVLINLLNNAIDAIGGLEKKWIRIDVVSKKMGLVEIRVTDSGALPNVEEEKKFLILSLQQRR